MHTSIKQDGQFLVNSLPEDATWDDLMYKIYVRQSIESGLKDSDACQTVDVQALRVKFGLMK